LGSCVNLSLFVWESQEGLGKGKARLEKLWSGLNLNSVEWFFSYLVVWERKGFLDLSFETNH
jgi:hypothetical protein